MIRFNLASFTLAAVSVSVFSGSFISPAAVSASPEEGQTFPERHPSPSKHLGPAIGDILEGITGSGGGGVRRKLADFTQLQDLTSSSLTKDDLVTILFGPDTPFEVLQCLYIGADIATGAFTGGDIGFDAGIVLTTGSVANVQGPNDSVSTSQNNGLPGDEQLSSLIGGVNTNDASVLEITFTNPTGSPIPINFHYAFGSEEYNEFVGSLFNDVFGFFLNGVNIATLPNGDNVAINSVNLGVNSDLYINNDGGVLDTELDGVTTVLQASGIAQPDRNIIRLSIADAGDNIYDSAVFIKAASFTGCEVAPGGCADPHFTTWSHEHFDFQGECDLVLIHNPTFMDGVGLTVHGRTKLHGSWSAFSGAAIKIGDDVLEIHGESPPILNGIEYPVQELEGSEYNFPVKIGGYSLTAQYLGPHSRRHIIHFGNGEKILINNFKEYVDFEVDSPLHQEFAGSVGLLGSYNTGTKLARDGKTVIDDADEFGQEWQVRVTDSQLFTVLDGPQYPAKCNMPVKPTAEQRHLRAMTKKVSEDDAKKACAKASATAMESCVADVFGSDDLDMAGIYVQ